MGEIRVFISHSKRNRRRAKRLANILLLNGIVVWFDEWEVLIGHNIYDKIYEGILSSDYLLLLITRASLNSRWVKEEFDIAKQKELESNNVVVLPLLYEKVELPIYLKKCRYADFTNFKKGLKELMLTLKPNSEMYEIDTAIITMINNVEKEEQLFRMFNVEEIRSIAEAKIVEQSALKPVDQEENIEINETVKKDKEKIYILYNTINRTVPLFVDLKESVAETLLRISHIFNLPMMKNDRKIGYFLIFDNQPLEINLSLEIQGVRRNSVLEIGCYIYMVE